MSFFWLEHLEITCSSNESVQCPFQKAILFPLLVKEDSFAEDYDLKTEADLDTLAQGMQPIRLFK